jgi:glycosyltransferase involved in cell wall biosynthesis
MFLSILIPTYNRSSKVKNLLQYLYLEISKYSASNFKISVTVGDNSTDSKTKEECINSELYKSGLLKYFKNEYNLGLVGNVISLANSAQGDYCWFMGDDDIYHPDILQFVQTAILEDNYSFVFLNHCSYVPEREQTTGFRSAVDIDKEAIYADGKLMVFDVWNYSTTSLMFISACIYKRDILSECLKTDKEIDLSYPLYMSFYCAAQGKARIIKEICIDNIRGGNSWVDSHENVFTLYVPQTLCSLPHLGYDFFQSKKVYLKYIFPQKKRKLKNFLKEKYHKYLFFMKK